MTDYKYKVTVGMPVYGVEKYIRKCILSVLNQTFKEDMEILAVDDRGPDNSIEIIKQLQLTHPRGSSIRIITQPKNMGCWAARNKILEEANGEYIFLLDSDDYISEDCIEKLYAEAIKHNAEAVYGSVMPVDETGKPKDIGQDYLNQAYMVFHEKDGLARFANKGLHPTFRDYIWNTLIRHDFIDKYNIRFKQARFCDDIICSADMTPLVTDAVLIPDYTYYYVIRENSLSNYQYRKIIKLEEIKESFRVYSYLKNKCRNLRDKDYFETRCTKGMILMFYAVCGALKNRDRIQPKLSNFVIKSAMKHPLPFNEIIRFRKYKYVNLIFYLISLLPAGLSVSIIKYIGKKKKYIP
jgi:glycosyltransferase involved in cell wall biosynthesis